MISRSSIPPAQTPASREPRGHAALRRQGLDCNALILLLGMTAGCGGAASTLEGRVTIDGQPAPAGLSLQFESIGGGTSAYAATDAEGHYEASETFQTPGVTPGTYRVRLMPNSEATSPPSFAPGRKAPARQRRTFPEKAYREIEVIEVKPGRNRHDIALPTVENEPVNHKR